MSTVVRLKRLYYAVIIVGGLTLLVITLALLKDFNENYGYKIRSETFYAK